MRSAPLNLTARDFDAYAPDKATSNAYSRPRLEFKQRALAWARAGVLARFAESGPAVDVHGSDEVPSLRNKKRVEGQWIYFSRGDAQQEALERALEAGLSLSSAIGDPDPARRRAYLALLVDASAVEVSFALHLEARADVENLVARLADAAAFAELEAALETLPEQFSMGVGREARLPCAGATAPVVADLVERLASGGPPLSIGWRVPRETAAAHSEVLDEELEDALVALGPIYALVAWSPDNDLARVAEKRLDAERERERAHADALEKNERWFAERARAREETIEAARARTEAERGGSVEPTPQPQRPAATRAAPLALEKGNRVRVRKGAFADKIGTVNELDSKGSARVMFGLLSSRFDVADLELVVEGRDRPPLQSSHRRPAPQVPRRAR